MLVSTARASQLDAATIIIISVTQTSRTSQSAQRSAEYPKGTRHAERNQTNIILAYIISKNLGRVDYVINKRN